MEEKKRLMQVSVDKENTVRRYCDKRRKVSFITLMMENELTYAETMEIFRAFEEDGTLEETSEEDVYDVIPKDARLSKAEKTERRIKEAACAMDEEDVVYWTNTMWNSTRDELMAQVARESKEKMRKYAAAFVKTGIFVQNDDEYEFTLSFEEYCELFEKLKERRRAIEAEKRNAGKKTRRPRRRENRFRLG